MNEIALLLRYIFEAGETVLNQRMLAKGLGVSLGKVNTLVQEAAELGYVSTGGRGHAAACTLLPAGLDYLEGFRVDNAIILAAGFGSRFVPFTYDTPKGLLEVGGQPMIEREIEQLHAVSITDIVIVVGYLKEKFDYLIDKYGVKLVFNPEYASKNNFASLHCALAHLKNTYLLVADHRMEENIFHAFEAESWVSCSYFEGPTKEWCVKTGAYGRITRIDTSGADAWALNGPAYFTEAFSQRFTELLRVCYEQPGTEDYYWEHILAAHLKELPIYINRQAADNVREFESLEELRRFDDHYVRDTDNAIMRKIAEIFGVPQAEITGIHPLKEGMTNQSFVFSVRDMPYVFRLPGKGTEKLLSRKNEKRSYELIAPLDISDEITYFDGETGVKISRYYAGSRVCTAEDDGELKRAMELLTRIHAAGIKAEHRFGIAEMIDFYESLAQSLGAIRFSDYAAVREKVGELLAFREKLAIPEILCHNDYIYANILWLPDGGARVIDWEYSGANDPISDVGMFSIYSYFTRERAELALSYYLGRAPLRQESARLYLSMALAGFLWSLWCEYKQGLGEEFGEYPLIQYRYMKDFYKILKEEGYLNE